MAIVNPRPFTPSPGADRSESNTRGLFLHPKPLTLGPKASKFQTSNAGTAFLEPQDPHALDVSHGILVATNPKPPCFDPQTFCQADSLPDFWSNSSNRLETFLVFIGLVGLALGNKLLLLIPSIRIYRLMCYFPTLEALLFSAIASTSAIFNLCLFIAINAVSFAVAGRYIFGSGMNAYDRSNFGTFAESLLTTLQLLTGGCRTPVLRPNPLELGLKPMPLISSPRASAPPRPLSPRPISPESTDQS